MGMMALAVLPLLAAAAAAPAGAATAGAAVPAKAPDAAAAARGAADAAAKAEPPADLASFKALSELCLATRPVERVHFSGDEVERAKARAAFVQAREKAMSALWRVHVPASGVTLGEYRPGDSVLPLDTTRPLHAMHGALALLFAGQAEIGFELSEQQAAAVVQQLRAGHAGLEVWFELDDSAGAVCSGSVAAQVFRVGARPVAIEIRAGEGKALARAETPLADRHRAAVGGYSGVPTVVVGAVIADGEGDARAIGKKLAAVADPLKACFTRRLEQNPAAGGTAVLGVDVGSDGRVAAVTFIADALGDELLHRCVDESVRAVRFGGTVLFRVPIELKLSAR